MRRKSILLLILFSVFNLFAENPSKKLLIVDSQDGEPYDSAREAMLNELERSGYIPGETLEYKRLNVQNKLGLGKRLFMKEADGNYDLIFVNGTTASISAYNFAYNNPEYKFIFCCVTDPVDIGLIESLNTPSNSNFTGITYGVPVETRLRFLKEVLPNAKKIGLVYANMPQSISYKKSLDAALKKDEFKDLEIIYRKVEFVDSNKGHLRMIIEAEEYIKELKSQVDVFLTPSDQLGSKREFATTVNKISNKPLMALTKKELENGWGAHFGVFSDESSMGQIAGTMIERVFNGEDIKSIIPIGPKPKYGVNLKLSKDIGIEYSDEIINKVDLLH